ncbi:MAG: 4Fe-4S dicluster domain-containing protein [Thermodesulfobacteriota bacterium]
MTSVSSLKALAPLRPLGSPPDLCLGCGTCGAGCPLTGVQGFDPRRMVRLALRGRDQELIESKWPWLCTMCGRCEYACPMGVNITALVRTARGLVDRDKVPGQIHKGVALALETGNNLGLPADDFKFIIEDVAAEMAQEEGYGDFQAPFDLEGANLLCTLHNKLVNTQNEDLVHWWKIFHRAGESWTIPGENWEGVFWGLFSGDDEAVKIQVGRLVEHMERLRAANLMYPE